MSVNILQCSSKRVQVEEAKGKLRGENPEWDCICGKYEKKINMEIKTKTQMKMKMKMACNEQTTITKANYICTQILGQLFCLSLCLYLFLFMCVCVRVCVRVCASALSVFWSLYRMTTTTTTTIAATHFLISFSRRSRRH